MHAGPWQRSARVARTGLPRLWWAGDVCGTLNSVKMPLTSHRRRGIIPFRSFQENTPRGGVTERSLRTSPIALQRHARAARRILHRDSNGCHERQSRGIAHRWTVLRKRRFVLLACYESVARWQLAVDRSEQEFARCRLLTEQERCPCPPWLSLWFFSR